jgi:hypothetical protein
MPISLVTAIDQSALASFVRDTIWVYPLMLTLHAIGLAFAAGVSVAMDLRVLGVASALPLPAMRRLQPLFYIALGVNAISGVGLVLNNPAKWLVDPLFYAKLTLLLLALVDTQVLVRRVCTAAATMANARALALVSLVLWAGAITAGRLLAYPYFR